MAKAKAQPMKVTAPPSTVARRWWTRLMAQAPTTSTVVMTPK
jgi:hypothetical protein